MPSKVWNKIFEFEFVSGCWGCIDEADDHEGHVDPTGISATAGPGNVQHWHIPFACYESGYYWVSGEAPFLNLLADVVVIIKLWSPTAWLWIKFLRVFFTLLPGEWQRTLLMISCQSVGFPGANHKWTLGQVMVWCRQDKSHYLNLYWAIYVATWCHQVMG